jgi:hypothetical protein
MTAIAQVERNKLYGMKPRDGLGCELKVFYVKAWKIRPELTTGLGIRVLDFRNLFKISVNYRF